MEKHFDYSNSNEIVILNARGVKFDMLLKQMDAFPGSRLAKLKSLIEESKLSKLTPERIAHFKEFCDDYDPILNELYFNKDPSLVAFVLNFYETRKSKNDRTHVDLGSICILELDDEMRDYWQINDFKNFLEPCCLVLLERDVEKLQEKINKRNAIIEEYYYRENFGKYYFPELREKIWNLVEYPSTSIYAKIYTAVSLFITCLAAFDIGILYFL
jgi:hypothetical protein